MWWQWAAGVLCAVLVLWLALIIALITLRPRELNATAALRLLPDVIRLVSRMARDEALPLAPRVWLYLLLGYLLLPVDLMPDFIPILGFADDAIITAIVLRYAVRTCGQEAVRRHWPGSPDGLAAVLVLAGMRR